MKYMCSQIKSMYIEILFIFNIPNILKENIQLYNCIISSLVLLLQYQIEAQYGWWKESTVVMSLFALNSMDTWLSNFC